MKSIFTGTQDFLQNSCRLGKDPGNLPVDAYTSTSATDTLELSKRTNQNCDPTISAARCCSKFAVMLTQFWEKLSNGARLSFPTIGFGSGTLAVLLAGAMLIANFVAIPKAMSQTETQSATISSTRAGPTGTGITEGQPFFFTISVPNNVDSPLVVNYFAYVDSATPTGVTNVGGGRVQISEGQNSGDGVIAMAITSNVLSTQNVTIVVGISTGTGYTVGSPSTINVRVKDNDTPTAANPVVSIVPNQSSSDEILEGSAAEFDISVNPALTTGSLVVNVYIDQSVTPGDNYLRGTVPRLENVTVTSANNSTTTLSLPTGTLDGNADEFGEDLGNIHATIQESANYALAGTDWRARITISDPRPVISISDAPDLTEGDGPARFKIQSDIQPKHGLSIHYTPEESSGHFLNVADGASGTERASPRLLFSRQGNSGPFESDLVVNLENDDEWEVDGSISVSLEVLGWDYTFDDVNAVATVNISDDESLGEEVGPNASPTISFQTLPPEYVGTESFGWRVQFNKNYDGQYVYYEPRDDLGRKFSYIDNTVTKSEPFPGDARNHAITLRKPDFDPDGDEFTGGKVTYSLVSSGDKYILGSYVQDSVIFANADKPSIELTINESSIKEGESFTLNVTATPAPASDLTIPIQIIDPNNWITESIQSVELPAMQSTVTKVFQTTFIEGTQTANGIDVAVTPGSGYFLTDSTGSVTVTVINSIKLSISDIATPVSEGVTATFEVSATADPEVTLAMKYVATGSSPDHNFLLYGSGTEQTASLIFSDTDMDGTFTADLSVPLRSANGEDNYDDIITVELLDVGLGNGYVLDHMSRSAKATIHDDTIPVLSIENAPATYANNIAEFKITATKEPKEYLQVNFTPTETGTMFLDSTISGSGVQRTSEYLEFSEDANTGMWVAKLRVPTQFDEAATTTGTITVTLNAEGSEVVRNAYAISATNFSATVSVSRQSLQNLTISSPIAGVGGIGVTEGRPFAFTVSAPEAVSEDTIVNYLVTTSIPTEIMGLANGSVTIVRGQSSVTGTIPMATDSDVSSGPRGMIFVNLVDETHYNLGSPSSITVEVKDNDEPSLVKISIAGPTMTTFEEGESITFTLSSNKSIPSTPPGTRISVNVDISETVSTGDNYLREGNQSLQVEFTSADNDINSNTATKTFTVHTGAAGGTLDEFSESAGQIVATLRDGVGYVLRDSADTASVTIDDPLPALSILSTPSVDESEGMVKYILESDLKPTNGMVVKFTPENIVGRYLNTTGGASGVARNSDVLHFMRNGPLKKFSAELSISLNDDAFDKVDGSITVSLNSFNPATYKIDSEKASVTTIVRDDDADETVVLNFVGELNSRYSSANQTALRMRFSPQYHAFAISYAAHDESGNAYKFRLGNRFLPYFRVFYSTPLEEVRLHFQKPAQDHTGADFNHGYVEYSLLSRGAGFYKVGEHVHEEIWYVTSAKPGIELTITENSVDEGGAITVNAKAIPAPTSPLTVSFTFVDPNNWLAVTSGSIEIPAMQSSMEKEFQTTHLDGNQDSNEIVVTATPSNDYYLDHRVASDSVTVNDIIHLSIGDAPTSLDEGATVPLTIVAEEDPGTAIPVPYSASSSIFPSSFLTFAENAVQTAMLEFSGPDAEGNYSAVLNIPLRPANGEDNFDEEITFELIEMGLSEGISLDADNKTATVTVLDDTIPILSIADIPLTYANLDATFKVSASVRPKSGLGIIHTPTETTTMFLVPTPTGSGIQRIGRRMDFTQDPVSGIWYVNLRIDTQVDPNGAQSGTISVQLNDESTSVMRKNFVVSTTDGTATVTVTSQPQTMSISSTAAGGNGRGVTEGLPFEFMVSIPVVTTTDINVNYSVESNSNLVAPTQTGGVLTIQAGENSATGTVQMASNTDVGFNSDAAITVTLAEGSGYRLTSAKSIVVNVKDNDDASLTNVSVLTSGSSLVTEGQTIFFTLRTNKLLPENPDSTGIVVNVDVSETVSAGEGFLIDGNQRLVVEITPEENNKILRRAYKTIAVVTGDEDGTPDDFEESSGTVTATVLDGIGYVVSATGSSAEVTVNDPAPTLSLPNSVSYDEGNGTLSLPVYSDIKPLSTSLSVNFTVTNLVGEFVRITTASPHLAWTGRAVNFSRTGNSGPFVGTISVPLTDNLSREVDNVFTMTMKGDRNGNYTVSDTDYTAKVLVTDNDPVLATMARFVNPPNLYQSAGRVPITVIFSRDGAIHNSFYVGLSDATGYSYRPSYQLFTEVNPTSNTEILYLQTPERNGPDGRYFTTGYVRYEILQSGERYGIGHPSSGHVWFVDGGTPGIELAITEPSITIGEEFTVTATATPAPAEATTVRFTIVDPSSLVLESNGTIEIPAFQKSSSKKFRARFSLSGRLTNRVEIVGSPSDDYYIDDSLRSDSVVVNANLLSIEDISTPVYEGETATFTVRATEKPQTALAVRYTGSGTLSGNNYLNFAPGAEQTASLVFEKDETGGYSADLAVPLRVANNEDDFDDVITVRLIYPKLDNNYLLDRLKSTATVTVLDDTVPELYVLGAPTSFSNNEAGIPIVSAVEPKDYLQVYYTPTESTTMFLDPTPTGSGMKRLSEPLEFIFDPISSLWGAELKIPTRSDPGGATSGMITVALIDEDIDEDLQNYVVNDNNYSTTVTISDQSEQSVTISSPVAAGSGNGVTEGRPFVFTVSVPEATSKALVVSYTVTTSNSTAVTGLTNGTITIPKGSSQASGTIAMAESSDVGSDTNAMITVTLVDGAGYSPGSPNNIVVAVKDNDASTLTAVSIAGPTDSTYVEGDPITFTVRANKPIPTNPPNSSISVNVDVSEATTEGDSFLRMGSQTVQVVLTIADNDMTASMAAKTFTVNTGKTDNSPDEFGEDEGTVTATVRDGLGYVLADSENSASVTIDDPLPVISIANAPTLGEGGGPAKFLISSDIKPNRGLVIGYIPQNELGNFLDETAGRSGGVKNSGVLHFARTRSGGDFTSELPLDIASNDFDEVDGMISVTLSAQDPATYAIDAMNADASVTITDDDADAAATVTLSTTADSAYVTGVTYEAGFEFNNPYPGNTIKFGAYDVEGNAYKFLHSSGNFQSHFTVTLQSSQMTTGSLQLPKPQRTSADVRFVAGFVEYRILSGGANSYKLGGRLSSQMWYVNGSNVGIELSVTEHTIREGEGFTVKATATPAPSGSPITVPFAFVDPNSWLSVTTGTIVIPAGRLSAEKTFLTQFNPVGQEYEEIAVTVTPMDTFFLSDRQSTDKVIVVDSYRMSIEDITTPVNEGGTASFTLRVSGNLNISIPFAYSATGTDRGNNFLSITPNSKQFVNLRFTGPDANGNSTAELTVPLRAANGVDDFDDVITVELFEESLYSNIFLDPMNRTATVTILDDTVPELSIANAPGIYSSLDAVFEVSTTEKPKGPLSVHYTPTEIRTSLLNPVPTGTGVMRTSPPLAFTEDTVNSKWVAELRVGTRIYGGGTASGLISIALNAEGMDVARKNYTVSASDSWATVVVTAQPEQNATISSTNAAAIDQGGGITEGHPFAFTVSVPEATTIELAVRYRVTTNSPTAITGLTDGTVTIPVGMNSASGTIAMAPGSDVGSDAGATITVALVDGSEYNLGSPGSIVVGVKDNDDSSLTIASITGPETAAVEGDTITFTVNLNRGIPATPPDSSVTVNVDIAETTTGGDSYLRAGEQTVRVTLTASDNAMNGNTAAREFTVRTGVTDGSPDDFGEAEATITATVRDGSGYVLADTGVIASATIDDPVPVISIADAPTVAEDGGPALFPIRSDILPQGGTLTVRHTAVNTVGRFLDIDAAGYGEPGGRTTTKFTRDDGTGQFTANLAIPLHDDADSEVDGTVTVTILADPNGTYMLGTGSRTVTVSVTDDEDAIATAATIARFPDVYEDDTSITLTLNYSGDGAVGDKVYIGLFDESGAAYHPPNYRYTTIIGTKRQSILVRKPSRFPNGGGSFTSGYVRFEILASGNRYELGHPMSGHVWYTDRDTSGISLSVMEGTVNEGQSFTVRATATPASQHAISVPVEIADPHGLLADSVDTDNLSVEIPAEAMYGELEVPTKRNPSSQTENTLTVAAKASDDYYLDDSVATATVSINYLPEVSVAPPTAGEGDGTLTFEVVLDENAGSGGVELTYSVAGTADGSSDYSIPAEYASPLTIPAGTDRTSLVVNLTDDTAPEVNETIILRFTSATGALFPDGAASLEVTGTITDDDGEPTVTVSPAVGSETGGMLSFPVEMNGVSGLDVTLAYEVAIPGGTATENTDFTLAGTMIVIGAGKRTGQIDVTIEPDAMAEGEETFILDLTLINAVFGDGTNISTVTGTITDLPLLTLEPVKTEFAETDYIHYAVTSDRPLAAAVTGTVSITADAAGVIDPLLTDDVATFTLNPAKQTDRLRIALEADSASATVTVRLNGGTGYTVQPNQDRATLTVIEGTGLPEISVTGQGMVTPGSMAEFTVTETPAIGAPPRTEELTVNLAVTGSPANFIAGTPGSSLILPVDSTAETFRVDTSATAVGQGTVTVEVLPGTGYKLAVAAAERTADVAVESAQLIVEVDDPPDTNESGGTMVFNFTLSGRAGPGGVSITYAVTGTATAGVDYTFASPATAGDPVVIAEDGTSGTLELNLIADGRDEADETVILTFAATGAEFRPDENVAEGVIIDNDVAPTISVADTVVAETEGRLAIPIELDAVSNRDVTLDYAVRPGGDARENSDFTLAGTAVTIGAGNRTGEIVVTVLDDLTNEGEESFTLTLTATNAVFANGTSAGTVTGTITDLPLVTIDTVAASVADSDFIICTVKTNPAPTTSVTGSVLVDAGRGGVIHSTDPTTTAEFTLTSTNPEAILRVPLIPDSGPTAVTVSLNAGSGYTVQTTDDAITVNVVDGTALPEISIEGGGATTAGLDAMFTVRAAGTFAQRLTVNMAASVVPSGFLAGTHQNTAEIQVGDPTGGYSVPTVGGVTGRGVVTAEVLPGAGYRLAANPARRSAETVINGSPVTITVTSPTAGEGDAILGFDIRLNDAAGAGGVSIGYTISGSASAGADFEIPSATVTPVVIPAGTDRGRIEFTVLEDTVDEDSETVVLTLTATGGAVFAGGVNRATGTITDNDPEPTVTVIDALAEEQDGNLTFTVELSELSERDVTVSLVGSPGGTAIAGSDYTLPRGPLTISAGNRSGEISIDLEADAINEGEETLTLNLAAVNAKFANGSTMAVVTGTITDLPLVSIISELREVADSDYIVYRVGTDAPLGEPVSGTVTITASRAGVVDTKGNKAFDFFKIGVGENGAVLTRALVPGGGPADVVISLDRGTEYTVNPDQDHVTVEIADGTNLPAVSVTGGDPASPGEDAVFTVSVRDEPGYLRLRPLMVNLGVAADRDGFLAGTHDQTVRVPAKDATVAYRVSTTAGDGEDATVNVAVLPGRDYKLTSVADERSAEVRVIAPPPLPVVTLEDVPTHATMGHSFTFTVRVAPPPAEPLEVAMAMAGLDSGGADGMISSTLPGTALVRGGTGTVEIPVSGVLEVTVSTVKPKTLGNGIFAVELRTGSPVVYALGAVNLATVTMKDNRTPDANEPRLSISGPEDVVRVTEEGRVTFVIASSHVPTGQVMVDHEITRTGNFLTNGVGDGGSVELSTSGRNTTLDVVLVDPPGDQPDGTVTVALLDGNDYVLADSPAHMATANVTDDVELETISIAAEIPMIEEGDDAVFTISSSDRFSSAAVRIAVSQIGSNILGPMGSTLVLQGGEISLVISTIDDSRHREDEGEITVTVLPNGTAYGLNQSSSSASVIITDNDPQDAQSQLSFSVASIVVGMILTEDLANTVPPEQIPPVHAIPTIEISTATETVEEGTSIVFVLHSSLQLDTVLAITVELDDSSGLLTGSSSRVVQLLPGNVATVFSVATVNDNLAKGHASITGRIAEGPDYIVGESNHASVTVTDHADLAARRSHLTSANNAILPELIGTIGAGALKTATERAAHAFDAGAGNSFMLGGQSSLTGLLTTGGESLNDGSLSLSQILDESSFELDLLPEEGLTSPATVWGTGDFRALSGGKSGHDGGEISLSQIGVEAPIDNDVVAGMATFVTDGKFEFGPETDAINYRFNSTGLHPYAGFASTNGELQLQVTAGYGLGEIELEQEGYESEVWGSRFYNFGLGGSNRLYSSDNLLASGTSELNITGTSWIAGQSVYSGMEAISDYHAMARHIRLGIEGSHRQEFGNGAAVTPSMQLGLREDGRNQQTYLGLELGGGLGLTDLRGMDVSSGGRLLLLDTAKIQHWGLSATFDYDFGRDRLGLVYQATPQWGYNSPIAGNTLWDADVLHHDHETGQYADGARLDGEIGYGIKAWDNAVRLEPYLGIMLTDMEEQNYRFGGKLNSDHGVQLELSGSNEYRNSQRTGSKYRLGGTMKW